MSRFNIDLRDIPDSLFIYDLPLPEIGLILQRYSTSLIADPDKRTPDDWLDVLESLLPSDFFNA